MPAQVKGVRTVRRRADDGPQRAGAPRAPPPGRRGPPARPRGAAGPVRIDLDSCQRSMITAGSSAIRGSVSSSQETVRGRSLSSAITAPASVSGAMALANLVAVPSSTVSAVMPADEVDARLSPTLTVRSLRTSRKAVQAAGRCSARRASQTQ